MPVIEPIGRRRTGYSAFAEYDRSLWSWAMPSSTHALTPRFACAKLCPKQEANPRMAPHAPRRRQQISDRKRCGHGDGRTVAPLLVAGVAVRGIAGSRRPAEEDRRDG